MIVNDIIKYEIEACARAWSAKYHNSMLVRVSEVHQIQQKRYVDILYKSSEKLNERTLIIMINRIVKQRKVSTEKSTKCLIPSGFRQLTLRIK